MPLPDVGEVGGELELGNSGPGALQQSLAGLPGSACAGAGEGPNGRLAERNFGAFEGEGLAWHRCVVGELEGFGEELEVFDGSGEEA